MSAAVSYLGKGVGRLALWLMPLTVIYEWVGGTFAKSMPERVLYLSLFLALFWLTDLGPLRSLSLGKARPVLGVVLLVVGALGLGTAFVWLLGPRLSLTPFSPPSWLSSEPRRLMLPLWSAWPLALGSALLRDKTTGARTYAQLGGWLALGFLLHTASGVHVQALPVVAARTATPWLLASAALVLLTLSVVRRGSFALRLSALLATGGVLRVLGILAWRIDPRVRDMLALVESAQDRFVEGHNPYALYSMQLGSELPLTYFPGLWLGYGAPRLLGLDLRFMGTLAELGLFALLARLARRIEGERRAWAESLVFCFAAIWLFSPSVQWNAIYAEPTLWWALLGVLLALAFSGRLGPAALALGYAVATRHFAIVLAPFVLLYFVRARGLRGALPYVATSMVIAVLLLTPFVAADPELFWFGTFRWLREYGPAHIDWFYDRFGFMQPFAEHDLLPLLPLVQAGLVLLCFIGACSTKGVSRIPAFAATALLLFIMFNVLLWDSFLLDGAIAAVVVVLTRGNFSAPDSTLDARAPSSPRALTLSLVGIGVTAVAGGYLAWTLVQTLHPRGAKDAHDLMVAGVKPGDFVIDRSDRHLAFVQGSWLLLRHEVPAPIGGELYDGAWQGQSALSAPGRAWMVTQTHRDTALRSSFARLGRVFESHDLEGYQVQAIEPSRARVAQTSSLPASASIRRCEVGWARQDMLAVTLSAQQPVTLSFAREGRDEGALLAIGFANGSTVWPHKSAQVTLHGVGDEPRFDVENLSGVQWRAWEASTLPARGPLRVELRTTDPEPRLLCLDLLWLPPVVDER